MESIIVSQTVARRRPASSLPSRDANPAFFGPSTAHEPRKSGGGLTSRGSARPGDTLFFRPPAENAQRRVAGKTARKPLILDQKPSPRPKKPLVTKSAKPPKPAKAPKTATAPKLPREKLPKEKRAFMMGSAGLAALASLPGTLAQAVSGYKSRLVGVAQSRASAEKPVFTGFRIALPAPAQDRARTEEDSFAPGPGPGPGPGPRTADAASERSQARKPAFHLGLPGRRTLLVAGAALLALALVAGGLVLLRPPAFPLPEGEFLPTAPEGADPAAELLLSYLSPEPAADEGANPSGAALPLPRVLSVQSHQVAAGESVSTIAKRYGLRADTIISYNGIKDARTIKQGAVLQIPNMDGVVHVVSRGESLARLSSAYKVDLTLLADANDLGSAGLMIGQRLFIPGARLPETTLRQVYGSSVTWPLRGPISSRFGVRPDPFTGVRRFHTGLDIVASMGSPVKAASSGKVLDVGYNVNYGNYVIMASADGLQFLYGHLSSYSVAKGQSIGQGTVIAKSGNTGYSTGPHLHFGVYRNGTAVDPLKFIK